MAPNKTSELPLTDRWRENERADLEMLGEKWKYSAWLSGSFVRKNTHTH